MTKEIKFEENPVLTSGEVQAVAILGLEGMKVNAYDLYLTKLRQSGKITPFEAGMAAVEYGKRGKKVY